MSRPKSCVTRVRVSPSLRAKAAWTVGRSCCLLRASGGVEVDQLDATGALGLVDDHLVDEHAQEASLVVGRPASTAASSPMASLAPIAPVAGATSSSPSRASCAASALPATRSVSCSGPSGARSCRPKYLTGRWSSRSRNGCGSTSGSTASSSLSCPAAPGVLYVSAIEPGTWARALFPGPSASCIPSARFWVGTRFSTCS